MRSLFRPREETTPIYTPPEAVAVPEPTVTAAPLETATVATGEKQSGETRERHGKRERVLTVAERVVRRRRFALATLAASLTVGGRWWYANQSPVYPVGEGVYQTSTAPKWGEMKQPNAATFYMAATDALDLPAINDSLRGVEHGTYDLSEQPVSVQKAPVALAKPALTLFRQGMQYPYLPDMQTNYVKSDPTAGRGLSRPVANFIALRETGRLFAAEASVRAAEGNAAGAIHSSLDAVRLGVDTGQGHTLVEGMIGVLIENIGAKEGMKHISALSGSEARAAASRLQTILERERSMSQMYTAERDWMYEVFRETYRAGNATAFNESSGLSSIAAQATYNSAILFYTKQGIVSDYAAYTDAALRRIKMPYQQAKSLPSLAESHNPIVANLAPRYERAFARTTQMQTRNRVLLTQLAVQAYKGEHGSMNPLTLASLTTGPAPYLQAVPDDPYSPSGKEALRYDGRTGQVYTVGENGADNGGKGDDFAETVSP